MDLQSPIPENQIEKLVMPSSAPKRIMFMLIAMTTALLATNFYLAFQNYQLKKLIGKPSASPFPTSSPISDPNADWKTHISKLGFEFKYPEIDPLSKASLVLSEFPTIVNLGFDHSDVSVFEIEKITSTTVLKEYGKDKISTNISNLTSLSDTVINGLVAQQAQGSWLGQDLRIIYISNKNEVYKISIRDNFVTQNNLATQILSTFKFTDSKTTTDYKCPVNGWVNCMPILNEEGQKACSGEALLWYKANCPNFQGVAQ